MFYPLIYLDAAKFLVLIVYVVIETTCPKIKAKTLPNFAKSLLPVDVRGLKRLCLKSLIMMTTIRMTTTTIIMVMTTTTTTMV